MIPSFNSLRALKHLRPSAKRIKGVTLMEIMVGIVVVGILVAILVPSFEAYQKRGEVVRCVQNLRSFHSTVNNYITDKGQWPQVPEEFLNKDEKFGEWWVAAMKPYGFRAEMWKCPTAKRKSGKGELMADVMDGIHYTPTPFGGNRFTPFKWSTQPWAVEIGDFHGRGNLILFPDGSVRAFMDVRADMVGNPPANGQ